MKGRIIATVVAACTLSAWTPAHADVVTEWNAVTMACAFGPPAPNRPGPHAALDIALVHGAVHDAVQAIRGQFESYAYVNPAMLGAGSAEAAAAAAAHGVLAGLYGEDNACLADVPVPAEEYPGDRGLQAGAEAAAAMLFQIRPIHKPPTDPFLGNREPGQWRPTFGVTEGAFTFLAHSLPFTMDRPRQFRLIPPPALDSVRYARDYNEVKALGADNSATRTAEQTDVARFWLTTPTPVWHATLRAIAGQHLADIGDTARLFALVSFALADAYIASYESAYYYNHWRVVTAIHEGDNDGNPDTAADPEWRRLFVFDPSLPEYPANGSAYAGAITETLQLFFETDAFEYSITSLAPGLATNPRHYTSFSQAGEEVVEAGIWLGAQFRTSSERGRLQGRSIAQCAFNNYLRPLPVQQAGQK